MAIRNQTISLHSVNLIVIENSVWILSLNSGILIYLSDFVASSLQKVKLIEVNSENNGSFALASYVQNWSNSLTPTVNDHFCKPDTIQETFFSSKNVLNFLNLIFYHHHQDILIQIWHMWFFKSRYLLYIHEFTLLIFY